MLADLLALVSTRAVVVRIAKTILAASRDLFVLLGLSASCAALSDSGAWPMFE